jgi:hypothetical protein
LQGAPAGPPAKEIVPPMGIWSRFWTWVWNNLYLSLGVMVVAAVVAELLGEPSEASFFVMGAGTLLMMKVMMKAEADRPNGPPPPPDKG